MNILPTSLQAATVFLAGVAFAAITPFRSIVGIDTLGLSNNTFALVMAFSAGGSAFASVVLGWLSDRLADRRVLVLICAAMGIAANGVLWLIQTPLAYMTAFCLLIPFGSALFSQSFSYSRAFFDQNRPDRAEFIMSLLRSGFTLAWIVVPPAAGLLAAKFTPFSVFGFAMVAHFIATVCVGLLWTQPETHVGSKKRETGDKTTPLTVARTHIVGIPAVVLAQVAIQINLTVLPLVIIRDLAGTFEQVGINAAFAAILEVPLMIVWGVLALRWRKDVILCIAAGAFAAYFVGMALAGTFLHVLALQVIAALAIAALLSINISYLQEVFPGRVGLSTSLLDVTMVVSALLTALIFAVFAGENYKPVMAIAIVVCTASSVLFLFARSLAQREAKT